QLVRRVEAEIAVACVDLPAQAAVIEDEEPVPLNGQIGRTAGGGNAPLAEVGGNGGGLRPQTALLGICPAVCRARGGTAAQPGRPLRAECDIRFLEAGGPGVGNVVPQNVDLCFVQSQSVQRRVESRRQSHCGPPSPWQKRRCDFLSPLIGNGRLNPLSLSRPV